MGRIVLYTTVGCMACVAAKALLADSRIAYREVDLQRHPLAIDDLSEAAHGDTTVPKLFFNTDCIGVRRSLSASPFLPPVCALRGSASLLRCVSRTALTRSSVILSVLFSVSRLHTHCAHHLSHRAGPRGNLRAARKRHASHPGKRSPRCDWIAAASSTLLSNRCNVIFLADTSIRHSAEFLPQLARATAPYNVKPNVVLEVRCPPHPMAVVTLTGHCTEDGGGRFQIQFQEGRQGRLPQVQRYAFISSCFSSSSKPSVSLTPTF